MASTREVIDHHLNSFAAGDLEGILADYGDDAVVFTQGGILKGVDAIKGLFVGLLEEFAKPGASFEMLTQSTHGDYAYLVWTAKTADNHYEMATDTFVMRDGKIVAQSLAAKVTPRA